MGGGEIGLDSEGALIDFDRLLGGVGNSFEQGAEVIEDTSPRWKIKVCSSMLISFSWARRQMRMPRLLVGD